MRTIILFWGLILGLLQPLVAQEQEVSITTLFPAPFGDFENVRSNHIELFGSLSSLDPLNPNPTSITLLQPLFVHRGLRILNTLSAPYTQTLPDDAPDFFELSDNRLFFSDNGGIFSNSAHHGLVFGRTVDGLVADNLAVRGRGNLFLQPGFKEEDGAIDNFSFALENPEVLDGTVFVQGDLLTEGNFLAQTGFQVGNHLTLGEVVFSSPDLAVGHISLQNLPNGTNGVISLRNNSVVEGSSFHVRNGDFLVYESNDPSDSPPVFEPNDQILFGISRASRKVVVGSDQVNPDDPTKQYSMVIDGNVLITGDIDVLGAINGSGENLDAEVLRVRRLITSEIQSRGEHHDEILFIGRSNNIIGAVHRPHGNHDYTWVGASGVLANDFLRNGTIGRAETIDA